ncbi:MAG: DUF4115 domain-containing protein, partial [Vulcanimicrobiaceae bacterium]
TPEPSATPDATHTFALHLTRTSWLRVTVDGTRVLEGTYPPGTVKVFHGDQASIRVGNAGGVDLTVNGKDLGLMGRPGGVVDKSLSLAAE